MMKPLSNPIHFIPDNDHEGSFGIERKHDIHTGIDIYCQNGDLVYSIEDGTIIDIVQFTGFDESPWWNDTYAMVIKSNDNNHIWLYGELKEPNLIIGEKVFKGSIIGQVETVLKKNKNKPMTMLHIELYSTYSKPVIWNLNTPCPKGLENPTHLIKKIYSL